MKLPDTPVVSARIINSSSQGDRSPCNFTALYPLDPRLQKALGFSTSGNNNILSLKFALAKDSATNLVRLQNLSVADSKAANNYLQKKATGILEPNFCSEHLRLNKQQNQTRILVIENRDLCRNYICSILKHQDLELLEAKDSRTAMELATSQILDLIICEFMMPRIDGYSLSNLLYQTTLNSDTRLLFITAHLEQDNCNTELFLIDDCEILRPLISDQLIKIVNQQIHRAIPR